jgi:hypothetical protein
MFKKSEAMGTMFIAMVFLAGLFASLSATTGNQHMKNIFYFETGADIAVEFEPTLTNVTMDIIQNITAVDGVAQASPMLKLTGYVQYWSASAYGGGENVNRSISVYGVQPDTWIESAFWLDYFTFSDRPQSSIPKLNESLMSGINIITTFKPISHYTHQTIGPPIPHYTDFLDLQVFTSDWSNTTECTIVDIMKDGLSGRTTYFPGESDMTEFLIMDISLLHNWINNTHISKIYVDLEPSANYTQVMNNIHAIAPCSFNTIEAAQEPIDEVLDSRATQSIFGAYTLNVLFSLIYLTFGMVIVTSVRVRGLRKQFSVLRALGAESKSMVVATLVDSATGLVLAAIIGGAIGTLLALLLKDIPLLYMGLSTTQLWTRLPVNLVVPWPLLAGIVGSAAVVSLLATYLVVSRALKLNIAEEIQYTG